MTDLTPQTGDPSDAAPDRQAPIGVSISESPDLARLGFGEEHLQELMGSVARAVLRLPGVETSLVYGGDLRPGGFTRFLFDIVSSERAQPTEARPEPPRRLFNYLAWPYYLSLSRTDQAQMINVCHFMRITPKDGGFAQDLEERRFAEQHDPPAALVASRCLTRMRELSTDGGQPDFEDRPAPPLRARILIGGKTTGYSSFMPGLFEELLIAREPGANGRPPLPLYIVGAFGGAAGQLAAALLDPDAKGPLTLDHQLEAQEPAGDDRLKTLLDLYGQHPELPRPDDRYRALDARVQALGAAIRGDDEEAPGNGLTPEENRTLLRTRDEVEIRRLIQKGLAAVCAGTE
jgi:hypothetical protein